MKICSVEGCNGKHYSKGFCNKHYQQMKKYGKILNRTKFDSNEIIEYEDFAEIILYDTNNEECARAIIDLEDIDKIKNYKWCFSSGYCKSHLSNGKRIGIHQLLIDCPEDMEIDHINRNPLDNRKENLRICTHQQNTWNRIMSSETGVYYDEKTKKWIAYIIVNGKTKQKSFKTKEEAKVQRKLYEIDYFGDFMPNKNDE